MKGVYAHHLSSADSAKQGIQAILDKVLDYIERRTISMARLKNLRLSIPSIRR
jgi:hypothetical protein